MRDFRVHSIDAKYVGPFEHLSIQFKEKVVKDEAEVHIFTGENGTGKSTVLYLLTCYQNFALIQHRIQSNKLQVFSIKDTYAYFNESKNIINLSSVICNYPNKDLFNFVDGEDILKEYFGITQLGNPLHIKTFDFAMFAYSGQRKIDSPKFEAIKEISEDPLLNSLDFLASSNAQILIQWIANTIAREALAFAKGEFQAAKNYKLSLDKLQQAIYQIIGINIKFELGGTPLNVLIRWNEVQMTFEVLPDGLKSIISWLGDLLMRLDRIEWKTELDIFDRNFILFLDEIDIHLHPAWQRKILPVVKKLFKNAQIFVSTHSPFVVGSVDGAWVYKLKKEGQYSVLHGEPILSEDAKSYRLILEEVFGIKEQFGDNIEKKLQEFYMLRKEILENRRAIEDETFQNIISELAPQSIELESILAMELRQLERIKKIKQLQTAL